MRKIREILRLRYEGGPIPRYLRSSVQNLISISSAEFHALKRGAKGDKPEQWEE